MNEIFGVPTTSIMVVLSVLLAFCLLVSLWVAMRRPVVFKMGVRNIPRRKAQTILIVVGLMLSTLIISAAMTTGDTLNNSVNSEIYDLLGHTDEVVVFSNDPDDANIVNSISYMIPESSLALVENALADHPDVDGIAPAQFAFVPIINQTTGLGEPEVSMAGIRPEDMEAFGGLIRSDGSTIDFSTIQPGEAVITDRMADELEASIGDVVTISWQNQAFTFTVADIARDQAIAGSLDTTTAGMVIPLDEMQRLFGTEGQYSAILISNTGGVRGAEDYTQSVYDALTPSLEGQSLGVVKMKEDFTDMAELLANAFTSIFIVMGLFSMAVGVLLIVLIFSMLAAERRSEMGMARAIGAKRLQLVQQFIAEGTGYALLAGLVGSGLGVLISLAITGVMGSLLGDEISIDPMVRPQSLIIAYCLGMVITFLAVVVGSFRISRLNIVSAIRDLPDVAHHKRRPRVLIFGIILTALGALMSIGAGDSMMMFGIGMGLWPFGVLLITRFFGIPSRLISTLAGLFIVVFWLLPDDTFQRIFGTYEGDFELFFISGIFLVLGSTVVIVQNLDLLLKVVAWFGGIFRSKLPAVRTAVAYPGAARSRTGMTIAMFSLIIFSLVMMATINDNMSAAFLSDSAAAGWTVRADTSLSNPVDDFEAELQRQGIDTSGITAVGAIDSPLLGGTQARLAGEDEWNTFPVFGMDSGYIDATAWIFQDFAIGYESDQAVIDALSSGQPVAVADSSIEFGPSDNQMTVAGLGASLDNKDEPFTPFQVDLLDPTTGETTTVTVIAIIDSRLTSMIGMFAPRTVTDAVYHGNRGFTSFYLQLDDTSQAEAMADQIESTMLTQGVQAASIQKELEDSQSMARSFLYLIQGFMGLGLVVGIAAIGVIAFRNVVERRQQIGVVRALGFRRSLVSLSFMIETAFVVLLGVVTGGGMGLLLARNLFSSGDISDGIPVDFTIPWDVVSVVLALTLVAALLMTWIPARQAARISPAEALRYE
ncbi:MAG: FtsX-like permease family protein [Thermomicrobiales bacterium]